MRKPDCWICNDMGMVVYEKVYGNISYEMASRCSCRRGVNISDKISTVGHALAEKLALANYNKHGNIKAKLQ